MKFNVLVLGAIFGCFFVVGNVGFAGGTPDGISVDAAPKELPIKMSKKLVRGRSGTTESTRCEKEGGDASLYGGTCFSKTYLGIEIGKDGPDCQRNIPPNTGYSVRNVKCVYQGNKVPNFGDAVLSTRREEGVEMTNLYRPSPLPNDQCTEKSKGRMIITFEAEDKEKCEEVAGELKSNAQRAEEICEEARERNRNIEAGSVTVDGWVPLRHRFYACSAMVKEEEKEPDDDAGSQLGR